MAKENKWPHPVMRYPGQLPANTTVTALVCQRQHISRWPVVVQSTAEIIILSFWNLIGWYVLHPAGPHSKVPWQPNTCLQGVFHRIPAALSALLWGWPWPPKGSEKETFWASRIDRMPQKMSCLVEMRPFSREIPLRCSHEGTKGN